MKLLTPLLLLLSLSCKKDNTADQPNINPSAYRITKSISYNNVNVDVIIDKPIGNEFSVLITYHGTVQSDSDILAAAETTLNQFKNILNRQDIMIISVAHPQLNILFGDNINCSGQSITSIVHGKRTFNNFYSCSIVHVQLADVNIAVNSAHHRHTVNGGLNLLFAFEFDKVAHLE